MWNLSCKGVSVTTLPISTAAGSHSVAACACRGPILIVASNPAFRAKLLESLSAENRVDAVAGGAEALAKLEHGDYAVALLDHRLADLDSQEVFMTMRTLYPDLEILWIDSANGATPSQVECENWGVDLDAPSKATFTPLPNMIGNTPQMQELSRMARLVAQRKTSVLLTGETGTGKELLARALHQVSPRSAAPFVVINCTAIPEELLEAELFGYSRGAFTGAFQTRPGRLHSAHGGVLFFDEIGELPLSMQVKLLRFLQNGEVQRLGCQEVKHLDVRVVAATNSPLLPKVGAGEFREDLYYRIAAFPLELPPLRERIEDIAALARHYLEHVCRENRLPRQRISAPALRLLQEHTWPGNVRELEHALERASILADGDLELRPEHFSISVQQRIRQ